MPPQPMSQCQQRRLAKSGYVLWVGLRRREGGHLVGSYLAACGLDAGEETLDGGV
ncbi:hypothetical protein V8E51_002827 [Hyaloscypha variabilis]